jgi:DNA-binding PadR family transcriptional regulator
MADPDRPTRRQLRIYAVLLDAYTRENSLHGYELMRLVRVSSAVAYVALDGLYARGLVERWFEELPPGDPRPRRRLYRLNTAGAGVVRGVLAERRPGAVRDAAATAP